VVDRVAPRFASPLLFAVSPAFRAFVSVFLVLGLPRPEALEVLSSRVSKFKFPASLFGSEGDRERERVALKPESVFEQAKSLSESISERISNSSCSLTPSASSSS
jgi:elongation factor P hydroxylase